MEIAFRIPKTGEEEKDLAKVLISMGVDDKEAESLLEILRIASKNKRLRDSVATYNERAEKGRLNERMKRCAIKEHLNAIIEGIRPKYGSCAGRYASQIKHGVPGINERALLSAAINTVNGIASQIRTRKSRLFGHKFTKSLLDRHPVLTEKAIEFLHFSDRFSLVKQDYETIDKFMSLLDLSKGNKTKK